MPHSQPSRLGLALVTLLVLVGSSSLSAQPLKTSAQEAVRQMKAAASAPLKVTSSPVTGLVTFISAGEGHGIPVGAPPSASAEKRALSFLGSYGKAFGIAEEAQVAVTSVSPIDEVGMEHVRVRQLHNGVPVTAGELMIHLRGANAVSANGETLADLAGVNTQPVLDAEEAEKIVRRLLEKHHGVVDAT